MRRVRLDVYSIALGVQRGLSLRRDVSSPSSQSHGTSACTCHTTRKNVVNVAMAIMTGHSDREINLSLIQGLIRACPRHVYESRLVWSSQALAGTCLLSPDFAPCRNVFIFVVGSAENFVPFARDKNEDQLSERTMLNV